MRQTISSALARIFLSAEVRSHDVVAGYSRLSASCGAFRHILDFRDPGPWSHLSCMRSGHGIWRLEKIWVWFRRLQPSRHCRVDLHFLQMRLCEPSDSNPSPHIRQRRVCVVVSLDSISVSDICDSVISIVPYYFCCWQRILSKASDCTGVLLIWQILASNFCKPRGMQRYLCLNLRNRRLDFSAVALVFAFASECSLLIQ